MMARVEDQ